MRKAVLTLTRYPSLHILTALHSMVLFRIPLARNARFVFFKLLGCGKNGGFTSTPDWRQYAIFTVSEDKDIPELSKEAYPEWKRAYYGSFISGWWKFWGCETFTIILEPTLSHGSWSGIELFPETRQVLHDGPLAVLTRARIRPSRTFEFWRNVPAVQDRIKQAKGLLFAVGIGEMPLFRQATFSVWEGADHMKAFAYSMEEHKDVIRQTRDRNWYSEEMFTRFKPRAWAGLLQGRSPLGPAVDN